MENELYNLHCYFENTSFKGWQISKHKMMKNSPEMFIVKIGLQYLHVYVNGEDDYTVSLHLLDLKTGEKQRISADFRESSLANILDKIIPSMQNPENSLE
jgi:hypothetical protein